MPRILEIVLIDFNEYLKGILQQILASYKILTELNDNPSDLRNGPGEKLDVACRAQGRNDPALNLRHRRQSSRSRRLARPG